MNARVAVQRPTKYSPNATPNMRPTMLSTGKWIPAMTRLVAIRADTAIELVDRPLMCRGSFELSRLSTWATA